MKIRILAAAATIVMALFAQAQAAEVYSFYFSDDQTGARVDGLIYGLSYNSAPNASPNYKWERATSVVITSLPDPFNGLGNLTKLVKAGAAGTTLTSASFEVIAPVGTL